MITKLIRRFALLQVTIALLPLWLSAQQLTPQVAVPLSQLLISTDGHLVMHGPVYLVLNNIKFTNNGNFTADSSNVKFTGELGAPANIIGGSTPSSFFFLTLHAGTFSGAELQQSITVTEGLLMELGNLYLNGYNIDLVGDGQILGESNASRIEDVIPGTGSVSLTRNLSASQAVNPGNIGIEITPNVNLGYTNIVRHFDPQTINTGSTGGTSIARWFSITPANNIGLNASARVYYLDNELGTNTASALDVWTGSDLMDAWLDVGRSDANLTQHWVQLDEIDHFNRVTLGNILSMCCGTWMKVSPRQQSATGAKMDSLTKVAVKVQAYPNPAHDQVALTMSSSEEKDAVIRLYDQAGHLLQKRMVHLNAGPNTLTWSLSSYPAGIYYLAPEGKEFQRMKVIKQ